MKAMMNLKALGLAGAVALAATSCSGYVGNYDKIRTEAKDETKDLLFPKGISAKEWEQHEQNVEKLTQNDIWAINGAMKEKRYWDSIKVKALVDEAYHKGAQAIRDSIKASEK